MDDIPLKISTALEKRKHALKVHKHHCDHFGFLVGLFPKARGCKLADIPTIKLKKLKVEYPPSGHDIYESNATQQIWEEYQRVTPHPDLRGGRTWKPFHKLNPAKLQYTVQANKSAIIQDSSTGEIISVVIRNFSNSNRRLLDWMNGIIMENNNVQHSVRVISFPNLIMTSYLNVIFS